MSRRLLLVGTQRGLFRVTSSSGDTEWTIEGPLIAGYEIAHAWLHPGDPRIGYAAARHPVWGAHVYRSTDAGRSWAPLEAVPHHDAREQPAGGLAAIWYLAPADRAHPERLYAGIDPPGLFASGDGGSSWTPVTALNDHPTRDTWEPARGGFAVHSVHVAPDGSGRMYAAVSAGGAYRSDDAGASWRPINRGVPAAHLPAAAPESGHNIHRLLMHPARPQRLYRQCYAGTYVSDDAGEHWSDVTAGLPGDFGYGIACDPRDADTVFVIPHESSHMRATVDGRLRVYRSRDGGARWSALTHGLPQAHAYVTVLREALDCDAGAPPGVCFGTTGGHLFASLDGGDAWTPIAGFLPRILSVKAFVID